MKIGVQSIRFNANDNLLAFIEKKTSKLDLLFDQIISGDVYLRIDKVQTDANKIAEIKLMIPGCVLFAKQQCKSFEEATDLAVESLKRQIRKYKVRLRSRDRAIDLKKMKKVE
ncbi:ribosomal subunit interface protein [Pseudopedobacter saltans DSM 12145]|uniref:Ribosomal subunit interface protein n=1 Tax=Pseudopedobacter saltans (strain ATCC 51119 / DSM 12145 / JCM 21818 / CCUG 39354 / LMG 10337 / NBRC 100064 / NCIMB 13643) TaxID=762903 RepID=F0SCI7_PSESL|nr:ribosome-associated translation inhibitor RaiA [Pseudopedobacter saltans]ADY52821.1 ribosomal subunit interface protein [Pseudopedobacter saltans DSM 12145]